MTTPTTAVESMLVENRVFPPSEATMKAARISGMEGYNALCAEAEKDFEGFWARLARENVVWSKPFTKTLDESNAPFYKWFDDGELNASANCLDKHMGTPNENKVAVIFEADDGAVTKTTYKELLAKVSQFANALKAHGIQKGDRVLIYMPMTLEGVIAMQACARIGATHSVVFGGFSAKALQERIIDAGAVAVVDRRGRLKGLVTDCDIRRVLEQGRNFQDLSIQQIMNSRPTTIRPEALASRAVEIMELRKRPFNVLPVVNGRGRSVGLIQIHDLRARGL